MMETKEEEPRINRSAAIVLRPRRQKYTEYTSNDYAEEMDIPGRAVLGRFHGGWFILIRVEREVGRSPYVRQEGQSG